MNHTNPPPPPVRPREPGGAILLILLIAITVAADIVRITVAGVAFLWALAVLALAIATGIVAFVAGTTGAALGLWSDEDAGDWVGRNLTRPILQLSKWTHTDTRP